MKKLKLVNLGLRILIMLSGAAMLAMWAIDDETWHKPLSYLVTLALPWAPDVVARVFGLKLSEQLIMSYEIFLIFAMVLGIDLDLYKTFLVTEDGDSYFDKIVHTGSGVLTAFVAKEVLVNNYDGKDVTAGRARVKKYNRCFAFLVIVAGVALIAVCWECFEFSYDQITGGHMQELVSAGVADTMWDLIGALVGGAITAVFISKQ